MRAPPYVMMNPDRVRTGLGNSVIFEKGVNERIDLVEIQLFKGKP